MAGAGYKLFATGDVLTAAQVNTYLNEQTVMVFADSAARTTALSGVLAEGMMSYLQDTDSVEVYDGSAWTAVGGGGSSPLTTKGDLYTFSTVDARLGVGANGTVLTADSAETTGLKWAAPAGGGALGI
jgi:trimeric autotransporter adhesin